MSILAGYYTEDDLLAELRKKNIKLTNKRTLRLWRQRREGPPYTKFGKTVLYPDDGFIAWLKAQTQQPVRERRRVADAPKQATA